MIDKSAFNKAVGSLIYTILRPVSEKDVRTDLDHAVGADLAKLVKLTNRLIAGNLDPATLEWKETIHDLNHALKPGGVCKDETIRVQAVKELEAVTALFKQATAQSKAASAPTQPPKANR